MSKGKRKGAGWEGLASSHILAGGSAGSCNRLQFRCTYVFLGPLPAASAADSPELRNENSGIRISSELLTF